LDLIWTKKQNKNPRHEAPCLVPGACQLPCKYLGAASALAFG